MRKNKYVPCCNEWKKAHDGETDNEGFVSLVWYADEDDSPRMGTELPPVRFCPWCGKEKSHNGGAD